MIYGNKIEKAHIEEWETVLVKLIKNQLKQTFSTCPTATFSPTLMLSWIFEKRDIHNWDVGCIKS